MDGEWVAFEVEGHVVQNRDGEDVQHNVLYSNYGPVLLLDIVGSTALVYRYAGYVFGVEQQKPLLTLEQVWYQLNATNVDEFKSAVAMQQMPMFTYLYSDHNGDLFYQSNSWTPDYSGLPVAYDWATANGPVRSIWPNQPQVSHTSTAKFADKTCLMLGHRHRVFEPPLARHRPLRRPAPDHLPALRRHLQRKRPTVVRHPASPPPRPGRLPRHLPVDRAVPRRSGHRRVLRLAAESLPAVHAGGDRDQPRRSSGRGSAVRYERDGGPAASRGDLRSVRRGLDERAGRVGQAPPGRATRAPAERGLPRRAALPPGARGAGGMGPDLRGDGPRSVLTISRRYHMHPQLN